jgi:G3E family GTPase
MTAPISTPDILDLSLPVTIITGFLGSGKTTLLNHILTQQEGIKTAVLVNEFGEIGIDNELIISSQDDIVELNNGCICCTINENLVAAVYKIWNRRQEIDYLVVETTGVADPLPIIMTFLGTDLRELTRLDSVITVVDCDNFSLDCFKDSEAAINQIAYGDIILLNKTDVVDRTTVEKIAERIRQIRPEVRLLPTVAARVPLPLILSVGLFKSDHYFLEENPLDKDEHHHHKHHHHSHHLDKDGFVSLSFESEQPFNIRKFQYFLDNQLPDNVFRAKGFIYFKDSPLRYIFHLSGKRFMIDDDVWKGKPKTQLVFIGQNLDTEKMRSLLAACLSDNQ